MITAFDILLDENAIQEKHDQSILCLETYFIIHYLNRRLKKYKLECKEITTLNLVLGGGSDRLEYNSEWSETKKVLACVLVDSYEHIKVLKGVKRTEKVLNIIEKSAALYEDKITGISRCVSEISEEFKSDNYQNQWVFQKKQVEGLGAVFLECHLTITCFQLYLKIENNKKEIYKKILLTTRPDSVFYKNLFKNIYVEGDEIHLLGRIVEQPFFITSIDEVLNGLEGEFQSEHPSMSDYVYDSKTKMYIYKLEQDYAKKKGTRWWNDFMLTVG